MSPGRQDVRCCTTCGAVYRAEYARCLNDGAELVVMSRDPLVGQTVGPYVVDALIGEGGMGRVYRVHHARLQQKRYALKVLLGDYAATPAMRMRFAKEAQSASRLSHPNVVAVCDFGVTDAGLAYLVMDLVEGTPLSALVTRAPMAPRRVIHLARQLCMGLAHAHDLGLIHRDFKPDNIIVVAGPEGEVPRIADFGLAITKDSNDVRLTTSGMVLGTPAYVSPEQVTAGDVDHRADLYALGVTLFELLSGGELPFDGDAAEIVGLKATQAPPKFLDAAPGAKVPPALAAIVDRLLARRPKDRYRDARAVAAALDESVRAPDDVAPAPAPAGERAPLRRRPAGADDDAAAIELAVTMPTPIPAPAPRTPESEAGVRTERVAAPRGSRRRGALLAGAIALAGLGAGGVVWVTRSTEPASAEPAAAAARPAAAPATATTETVAATAEPAAATAEPAAATAEPAAATAEPAAAASEPAEPKRPDRARPGKRAPKRPPARRVAEAAEAAPRQPDRMTTAAVSAAPTRPEPTAAATAKPEPTIAAPQKPEPAVAAPATAAPQKPEPAVAAPAAPQLAPRLASLDVNGALPNATVRRALDRVLAGARACRSDRAGDVEVRFTIGESRRAAGLRATGLAASRCLAAALSGIRTDSAPDVGDAEVRVRFTYDKP